MEGRQRRGARTGRHDDATNATRPHAPDCLLERRDDAAIAQSPPALTRESCFSVSGPEGPKGCFAHAQLSFAATMHGATTQTQELWKAVEADAAAEAARHAKLQRQRAGRAPQKEVQDVRAEGLRVLLDCNVRQVNEPVVGVVWVKLKLV